MAMPAGFQRFGMTFLGALKSVGRSILLLLIALPFLGFVYLKATNPPPPLSADGPSVGGWAGLPVDYVSLQWFAVFSSVAFMGALGSTVSFFARHDVRDHLLEQPRTLQGTQLLGAVFASVLLFTFIGGLVQGSLFPRIEADSWRLLFFRVPDWSKLLVWSFIAGFSERFVPDLLDNLILRRDKDDNRATQTADQNTP